MADGMADTSQAPWPGYPQVPSFLQQQQGGGLPGGINNIVRALTLGAMSRGTPNTAGLGRFEGQVASPANPFTQGTYGMQSPQMPPAQATAPPSPWGANAQPVPYADPTMAALFSQPPTS